jgi:glycolate dehydrogenase iron-sulfur subunit
LSRRKMENIRGTKARLCITSNAGCALQIVREARAQGLRLAVAHPMEVLDWSYGGGKQVC